ncbi:MAG: hypothetical protein EA392_13495 [Cryomorphaceae bacterium]|nr:MAG: hypothetical protein EA392_13495 [Cryomorphaceae bacterium]
MKEGSNQLVLGAQSGCRRIPGMTSVQLRNPLSRHQPQKEINRYRYNYVLNKCYFARKQPRHMKNSLLIILLIIALAMVVMGILNGMIPPVLTGLGFVVIAWLIYRIREV